MFYCISYPNVWTILTHFARQKLMMQWIYFNRVDEVQTTMSNIVKYINLRYLCGFRCVRVEYYIRYGYLCYAPLQKYASIRGICILNRLDGKRRSLRLMHNILAKHSKTRFGDVMHIHCLPVWKHTGGWPIPAADLFPPLCARLAPYTAFVNYGIRK
jgi:hypothetical protein